MRGSARATGLANIGATGRVTGVGSVLTMRGGGLVGITGLFADGTGVVLTVRGGVFWEISGFRAAGGLGSGFATGGVADDGAVSGLATGFATGRCIGGVSRLGSGLATGSEGGNAVGGLST